MNAVKRLVDKTTDEFIGHIRESDLSQPKDFQKLLTEGMEIAAISTEELAAKFTIKASLVDSWKSGAASPPVIYRPTILKWILECVINKSKYAN